MSADNKTIQSQNKFCKELMDRLYKDINHLTNDKWLQGHTTCQNDIVRLRRELLELSKMLNWDYGR